MVDRKHRIGGEYKIYERIGRGGFSEVYRVVSRSGEARAAKFVGPRYRDLLQQESEVMISRSDTNTRRRGTIYKYFYGRHGDQYVLVMDLLGKSLWDLQHRYRGLSTKTVLMLGIQMTKRVEDLHTRGYLHRDIKPDNFVVGRELPDAKHVYLIDYGFAERYKDSRNKHVERTPGHHFIGTRSFASKYSHRGEQQSRRCDLESLGYTMIYLYRGRLPWDGMSEADAGRMKENISAGDLCRKVPEAIKEYFRAVRELDFTERPDYDMLIEYLKSGLNAYEYELDNEFEWTVLM